MLSKGDTVLAGVSGGADSMLLLNLLLEIKDDYELIIEVAHVEHGIRGEASKKDAEFVKAFCDDKSVPFHLLEIDAVNEAKAQGMSVEEYSRKRRYEFFGSIECDKIATAHNLSDNIETVLFRLARGTGLKGACGIPPVRGKIIRPLIRIPSEEIREYCAENGIAYRDDETNFSDDYSRNFIRHKIVEPFKELNSNFEENFGAFIDDVNEDYSYIDSACDRAYDEAEDSGALDTSKLTLLPPSVAKRTLIRYFAEKGEPLDRKHLDGVYLLINKAGKLQLSENRYAVMSGKRLRIADLSEEETAKSYKKKILKIFEFNPKTVDFYCDCDKIIGRVTVRCRQEGDTVSPVGRGCSKSLKKLFNEYSVPIEKRASTAVICDENGVIGVEGICCDERVKIDDNTERVFTLTVCPED